MVTRQSSGNIHAVPSTPRRRFDLLGYPIVVSSGGLAETGETIARHAPAHRYAVITDENVARAGYLARVIDSLVAAVGSDHVVSETIAAGEREKSRERWASLTDALLRHHCGRDTTIVALGGGVIGDLAGFVAATYMRGVPVVQIPTTLVAMVDASVGGKVAVDVPAGKNLVGAFHQPAAVVIDTSCLATLPEGDLRNGFAEVFKHGFIADASYVAATSAFVTRLRAARDSGAGVAEEWGSAAAVDLVARSVAIKADIVHRDPHESGLRALLNFGHTIGHAIEAASDYGVSHGEAVAIGMASEARLAERIGVAEPGLADDVEAALGDANLPTRVPADVDVPRMLEALRADKKIRQGTLRFALPERVGRMAGDASGWSLPVAWNDVASAFEEPERASP
jgi:3-dehydroquinate synthase